MKKGKAFFHPIEGTGALSIYWSLEPKGNAIEANTGEGVGFFSKAGKLLCVIFDEVREDQDHQILEFNHDRVEVTVKNGRVSFSLNKSKTMPRTRRKAKLRR